MDNPYDLHSWSKRYREEVLREARTCDLVRPTRTHRSGARAAPIRTILLSLLGRKRLAG